jgi:hypothetical protein
VKKRYGFDENKKILEHLLSQGRCLPNFFARLLKGLEEKKK